jgi:hypothetical protein
VDGAATDDLRTRAEHAIVGLGLCEPVTWIAWDEGCALVSGCEEERIVLAFTAAGIRVGAWTLVWQGAHSPADALATAADVPWPDGVGDGSAALLAAVDDARRRRDAVIRPCIDCGERFGPERLVEVGGGPDDVVCHGCAERNRGVAF